MKVIFVAFLICAVYLCTASALKVECPKEWPGNRDYVLMANPCNCNSFFVCREGLPPILLRCPEHLDFYVRKQMCDYPDMTCKVDPGCPKPQL